VDSRIRLSRWLLLTATIILWAAVAVSITAGAGVPWITVALALLASVMAVLVWTRL
jgi:hypothetical protein